MRYPLIIGSHNRIVIAPEGWCDRIGELDVGRRKLRLNVSRIGTDGLSWIIDANGMFYTLKRAGLERRILLQVLGLKRAVETYEVQEPCSITNGELAVFFGNLAEQFPEASNSADLLGSATARNPETVVTAQQVREYLGSKNAI